MIYFLIPVFEEQENIPELALSLKRFAKDSNREVFFVFVDDCSRDLSLQLIHEHFHGYSYHIIEKNVNIGPGDSFNKGFEWILFHCPTNFQSKSLIVTIEADNTSDLGILPIMIQLAENKFDLVLASVYAQGGGFEKTGILRVILSITANFFFRAFFNIKTLTISSFYRVYKYTLIEKLNKSNSKIINEKGFISMLEILLKAIKIEAEVIEVPMKLKSSLRKGRSKMKVFKTSLTYLKFLFFSK